MPSVSDKQKVAMAIACHDPEKSTSGIPQDVACEFNKADARKRAKRKVKEALEFLGARKMVENVRSMSFTKFLVEDASKPKKRSASDIVADIRSDAHKASEGGHPAGRAYLKRVLDAEKEEKEEHRMMGAVRARDAYQGAKKEGISFEDAELLLIAEAVEIPADASADKLKGMIQAALRAKEIAAKLKDEGNRTKREGEIAANLKKLRAAYADAFKKTAKTKADEGFIQKVDAVLTEWEVLEEARKKKKKPSAGLSRKQKSSLMSKARKGKKVFGGHFKDVEKKAAKEYGSKESGEKVAAAAMWKKKARLAKESLDLNAVEVDLVVEQVVEYKKMMKKLKKVFERTLTTDMYEDPKVLFETAAANADDIKGYSNMTDEEKEQFVIDTCVKYELTEAFGDDMHEPEDGMDDPESFSRGASPDDQQIGAPQSGVSRASFKLEPEEIGKVATYVAQFIDYPPEEASSVPGVMKAIRDLEHADLFHLTPSEVIMARKLLTFGDKYGSQEGQAGGM